MPKTEAEFFATIKRLLTDESLDKQPLELSEEVMKELLL